MNGDKDQGDNGNVVQLRKLLGIRLLAIPADPRVGALEIRSDGGVTTYLVTHKELDELGRAFHQLAAKLPDPHAASSMLVGDSDVFHFGESDTQSENG
jgi:hypothetical protein